MQNAIRHTPAGKTIPVRAQAGEGKQSASSRNHRPRRGPPAEREGLPPSDLPHVRRGAFLHDIGKMGIPDSVLLKHGTLNEREWEIMRRHPELSQRLIEPIEYLRPALDIPYCHHEKWDGTGYPRGLHGDQIPLAARIFAIIDVWDALCSDRPYRAAWSCEQALAYIRSEAGKHFDPAVVAAFLKIIPRASSD